KVCCCPLGPVAAFIPVLAMAKSAPVFGICQVHPAKSPGSRENKGKIGSQKQPILRTNEWITQAQAARIRRVSRQAIAKLIRKGTFSRLEIGGRIFLLRREVEQYRPAEAGRPRSR